MRLCSVACLGDGADLIDSEVRTEDESINSRYCFNGGR